MVVLLITGAIDISSYRIPLTALTGVEQRLSQYISSIQFAIDHYKEATHLVFCENTGYPFDYSQLTENARLNNKYLEVITFHGDYSSIQRKGKGYGEGEIIEYAIKNSRILKECKSFYKLTGRIQIENFDKIVNSTSSDNAFEFHSGAIYNRPKDHIETLFFKSDKEFYTKYLLNAYNEVDEYKFQYLEHIFCERLKDLNLGSFKIMPRLSGLSGTTGKNYKKKLGEMWLEKIYFYFGIHNLCKNSFEKFINSLLITCLRLWRNLKSVNL